jgi:hypothetical protein
MKGIDNAASSSTTTLHQRPVRSEEAIQKEELYSIEHAMKMLMSLMKEFMISSATRHKIKKRKSDAENKNCRDLETRRKIHSNREHDSFSSFPFYLH